MSIVIVLPPRFSLQLPAGRQAGRQAGRLTFSIFRTLLTDKLVVLLSLAVAFGSFFSSAASLCT